MSDEGLLERVEAVRRFNRFYTKRIGVLLEGLLHSPFSLAEARVIYELAQRDTATATDLGRELGLDAGYLSRLLRGLRSEGLILKAPSENDGRQSLLRLTEKGEAAFAMLNARSRDQFAAMLNALPVEDQGRLVKAMHRIEEILGARPEIRQPYILRPHQPGDMGWVVHRHAVLYAAEYGFDEEFEALVAEIAAAFIKNFGVPGQEIAGRRQAAHAADRAPGAGARPRRPAGRGMRDLRPPGRLSQDHALDQQRAVRRHSHL
jgi:DNA-binding MarR family transcriptional regulator